MRNISLVIICLVLAGCFTGMPGHINVQKSDFDKSTEVTMAPGFVYRTADTFSGSDVQLGLHWSSASVDTVWIKAVIQGEIVNIRSDDGLWFNIDEDIVKLSSNDVTTDFDTSVANGVAFKNSSKSFPASIGFIEKLVDANLVKVKLITGEGYVEGDFKLDKPSSAIRGFKEFLLNVRGINN